MSFEALRKIQQVLKAAQEIRKIQQTLDSVREARRIEQMVQWFRANRELFKGMTRSDFESLREKTDYDEQSWERILCQILPDFLGSAPPPAGHGSTPA